MLKENEQKNSLCLLIASHLNGCVTIGIKKHTYHTLQLCSHLLLQIHS